MLGWIPQVVSFWFRHRFLSPQKWEGKLLVSFVSLKSWYFGRQSIAKLTAHPYFMILDWLLIASSHTVQSVWNILMFLKLVELIHLFLCFKFPLEHFRHQNSWSISDSALHVIFKASPVSLFSTRTTSLPRCVKTRSDLAAKILSCNLEVCA